MSALVLDTETTGINAPDVIQLAARGPYQVPRIESDPVPHIEADLPEQWFQLFRPRKPITFGAMATHHILESDLVASPLWTGSWPLPAGVEYLIGHKVDFDWGAIGSPHIARICTLALARSLWPDCDSHSLGALTYYLNPPDRARQLLKGAHDAEVDAYLCELLVEHILRALPAVQTWHDLWRVSEQARVPKCFRFGKYAAKDGEPARPISEVRKTDPSYIGWCLKQPFVLEDPYLVKALRGEAA